LIETQNLIKPSLITIFFITFNKRKVKSLGHNYYNLKEEKPDDEYERE
jgi:hypothetical protein